MPHRQTVEFLRRRYAAAILCNDADTACRLRAQLDGIMNPIHAVGRPRDPGLQAPPRPLEAREIEPAAASRAAEGSAGSGPRLYLVPPVTGLLEGARARHR